MKWWSMLMLLLMTACSSRKQLSRKEAVSILQRQESSLEMDALQQQRTGVHLQTADAETQELIKIVPKGVFSFQPDSGFKGEADTVWIRRRIKKRSQSRDSTQTDSSANSILQQVTEEKRAKKNRELNEQKSSERFGSKTVWAWSVILVLLLGIGIYLKFRR